MGSLRRIKFSDHAVAQIAFRRIDFDLAVAVALQPGHSEPLGPSREVRQSVVTMDGRLYLPRVIVDQLPDTDLIVTAYRTRKFQKYGGPR